MVYATAAVHYMNVSSVIRALTKRNSNLQRLSMNFPESLLQDGGTPSGRTTVQAGVNEASDGHFPERPCP